jgi:GT2 family glycosyltransferase
VSKQLPVIVAIPNYNMANSLSALLAQLVDEDYDAIYVLDDASTDGSQAVVATFGTKVCWVGSETNLGAGGNRNRILQAHPKEGICHFFDADVRLETNTPATKARQLMAKPNLAFVGGLVFDPDGKQSIWSYGPDSVTLYSLLTALVQHLFGKIQAPKPWWRQWIRVLTKRVCNEWPDIAVPPQRRTAYWVLEGNLLVRRSVLEKLGGFDSNIHEYDIIPPARKAQELGLVTIFDPTIVVTHLAVDVRHYNRALALYKELYRLIKRYGGWKAWLLPEGRFKPPYNRYPD